MNEHEAAPSIDAENLLKELLIPNERKHDVNTNSTSSMVEKVEPTNEEESSPRQHRKKGWRKPQGMPKRPMSSYNLFFQLERERLVKDEDERVFTPEDIDRVAKIQKQKDLSCHKRKHRKSHGKISFSTLARVIADKWKVLDTSSKTAFFDRAALEKDEYKVAVDEWVRSNKCASPPFESLSPIPPVFLAEPIESPPSCDEQYTIQNQSANTSPEIAFPSQLQSCRQEMWDTAENNAIMDQMMMNNNVDNNGSWMARNVPDLNTNMVYSDNYQSNDLNGVQNLRNLQSPTRPQLQPRFVPFSPDCTEQVSQFGMNSGMYSGTDKFTRPFMVSDPQVKYSPSSALDNIYRRPVVVPQYGIYDLSPNQNVFAPTDSNGFRPHVKMMRSRSFPVEEKLFIGNEMAHQQSMQFAADEHCYSQQTLYYPAEYGTVHELAGLPLDSLVEVSPGQYIDPSVYNVDMRKSNQFMQRRSTFSGGYNVEDNSQAFPRMNQWYRSKNVINERSRHEPLRYMAEVDRTKSFPPVEIITIRRGPRTQELSPEGQDYTTESQEYRNPSLPSRRFDQDSLLGSYMTKQHFPHDNNRVYLSDAEEKAAIDLVSLAGSQSQRSTYAKKNTDDTRSFVTTGNHPDQHLHSIPVNEDREMSSSNAVDLNYHDDASYAANHWEV